MEYQELESTAANELPSTLWVPPLKGSLPFRLGTSSYIIPAEIVPNVEVLGPCVDDVELVLFESHEFSNLPDDATIARLAELAAAHGLSYTVHFPLDTALGAADEAERLASVEKCLRVYRLTRSLEPHSWVLHFHGERRGMMPVDDPVAWRRRLSKSAAELLAGGVPPERVVVETLDYPYELVFPVVEAHGLSVCLDVGHELMSGRDPLQSLVGFGERCRVVHLHGVRDGRDHTDVGALEASLLRDLWDLLRVPGGPRRVVTLEVFSQVDFERSMVVLKEVWR